MEINYRESLAPTLCHGKSGVLLQLLYFSEIHSPQYIDLAFSNSIIDYKESYIYKFKDCEKYDGRRYYLEKTIY
jgi:hypothetical protein